VVVVVAVVALIVLMNLAYDRADTCAGRAADDSPLQAAAEECAKDSSAPCSNQCALARPDSTLIAVAIIVVAVVVVLTTATAIAHSIVKVGISVVLIIVPMISILAADGENHCSQHQRCDEYSFTYLHHLKLDADLDARENSFYFPSRSFT
jgi:hypothetical protein